MNGGVDILVGANDEREGRIVRCKAASSEKIGEDGKGETRGHQENQPLQIS